MADPIARRQRAIETHTGPSIEPDDVFEDAVVVRCVPNLNAVEFIPEFRCVWTPRDLSNPIVLNGIPARQIHKYAVLVTTDPIVINGNAI